MKKRKIIKVVIVDDRLDDALRYAAKLAALNKELVGAKLMIEISNNAYFVADRMINQPADNPPWDIIISDVNMPVPDSEDSPGVACPQAVAEKREWQSETFTVHYWKPHTLDSPDAWKHGGVHIAECLEKKASVSGPLKCKLMLVSRPLKGRNRRLVQDMVARNHDWLDYIDKDRWESERIDEDGHLMDENMFVWALLDSMRRIDRADWGHANWVFQIGGEDEGLAPTGKMRQAITRGRQWVQANQPHILIRGEEGTGRTAVARILAQELLRQSGGQQSLIEEVDCAALPTQWDAFGGALAPHLQRAQEGVLILKELDRLQPLFQAKILGLIRDRRFRPRETDPDMECRSRLVICITREPATVQSLVDACMFDSRIMDFFGDFVVDVPALRDRPEDFESLVSRAVRLSGHTQGLDSAAVEVLRKRKWKRNVAEMFSCVRAKCASVPWRVLTGDDFQEGTRGAAQPQVPPEKSALEIPPEPIEKLKIIFTFSTAKNEYAVELSEPGSRNKPEKRKALGNREVWLLLLLAAEREANQDQNPLEESPDGDMCEGIRVFSATALRSYGYDKPLTEWIALNKIPADVAKIRNEKDTNLYTLRQTHINRKWDKLKSWPLWLRALALIGPCKVPAWYRLNCLGIEVEFRST